MAHAKIAAGIIAIICSTAAFAQITTEEAAARLKQREAARQAAATQPATITKDDLAKLQAELWSLRAENAQLKYEITKLKDAQAGARGPADEIKKAITEHRLVNGMTVREAEKALDAKLEHIADSSEGTTYRGVTTDKVRPNPNSGALYTGTGYTIFVRDGVVTDWRSRRYFIGTDGLSHDQQ